MPLCGFNKKMLEGLAAFQEGLVEHGLYERSKETDQTYEERLNEELSDMDRFSPEMHRINDPEMRDITIGLSTFAKAFYRLARRKGLDDYKETTQAVNNFFIEMDKKYYGEKQGEGLQGKPNSMRQLAEYLDTMST
ncbi:hypothetical protein COU57_00435 [Candidatus Pacearchaeota archaeon CG10_big_fil_rev_8_21_14_0_10_32_14]|nr:MAG: hypothetical protein COU57_00435 [Candidatus Pacearchaeota archaeon CG10_big_fil_rev_8_21_14_0_10_32_14]